MSLPSRSSRLRVRPFCPFCLRVSDVALVFPNFLDELEQGFFIRGDFAVGFCDEA